jgi:hypothetical protein
MDREDRLRELGFKVVVMWHADWCDAIKNMYD